MPSVTHGEELTQLHRSIGVVVVGYVLSMILYGFNSYQIYIYFTTVQQEHFLRKWAIAIIALLDSTSVGTLTQYVHFYLIQEFPTVLPAVTFATREFCADNAVAVIMIFIVQLSYAQEVKKHNSATAIFVAIIVFAEFALGLTMSALMSNGMNLDSLGSNPIKAIIASCQFFTFTAGFVTFLTLYLHEVPTRPRVQAERMWYDYIIKSCFEQLALATLIQLGYFIAFVTSPEGRFWMAFQIVARRIFTLSLVTLYINRAVSQGRMILDQSTSVSGVSTTVQVGTQGTTDSETNVSTAYGSNTESVNKHDNEETLGGPDIFRIAVTRSVKRDPPLEDEDSHLEDNDEGVFGWTKKDKVSL